MSDPAFYGDTWAPIYDAVFRVRYVWPSELDLMAQLAGLRLRERWGDWRRGPYTGSGAHVSIYERG